MSTRAGRLNRQITIERIAVLGDDGYVAPDSTYGTPKVTWVPLVAEPGSPVVAARFWAEVQDALPSKAESVVQGLSVARNQTRIRMRWRSDINSSMRITVHGDTDTIFQIVGGPAEIDGRKERIEMMCEKTSS